MSASINSSNESAKPVAQTPSSDTVTKLRDKAAKSPAFKSLCAVFSARERSRQQITVNAMYVRLIREGHNVSKDDVVHSFKFLETLGIGHVYADATGKIRSLKDIKVSLRSVGEAALVKPQTIESRPYTPSFAALKSTGSKTSESKDATINLTLTVNGDTVPLLTNEKIDIKNLFYLLTGLIRKKAD